MRYSIVTLLVLTTSVVATPFPHSNSAALVARARGEGGADAAGQQAQTEGSIGATGNGEAQNNVQANAVQENDQATQGNNNQVTTASNDQVTTASNEQVTTASNDQATQNNNGVINVALVPDFGVTPNVTIPNSGDCVGLPGKPPIPCDCPPDRDAFIQQLTTNVQNGNSFGDAVSFPEGDDPESQRLRKFALSVTLQNFRGSKGSGCPIVSTNFASLPPV